MTAPLRTVAHGLSTVATGIHLTLVPTVIGGAVSWCAGRSEVILLVLGVALIGVIVTAVGRCFCLRTPSEMPVARARICLAVILDLTGLGSTAALVVSLFAIPAVLPTIGMIGLGFSAVTLIAGRLMFLAFLHALAVSIRKEPQSTAVRSAILWSVQATVCLALSLGAIWGVGQGRLPEVYFRTALVIGGISCLILGGIWWRVYTQTLNRLSDAVEMFANQTVTDADSPDHEYRARYPVEAADDDLT